MHKIAEQVQHHSCYKQKCFLLRKKKYYFHKTNFFGVKNEVYFVFFLFLILNQFYDYFTFNLFMHFYYGKKRFPQSVRAFMIYL